MNTILVPGLPSQPRLGLRWGCGTQQRHPFALEKFYGTRACTLPASDALALLMGKLSL